MPITAKLIPLSDDEINELYDEAWMKYKGTEKAAYYLTTGFARAIEKAHGIE